MAKGGGKGAWALGAGLLALGAWWLLRQPAPPAGSDQAPVPTPVVTLEVIVATPVPTPVPKGPRLAICIDDWGYQSKPIEALAGMGIPLTTAILPHLAFSQRAAEASHAAGNEVILHCPMQAQGHAKPEAGTLKAGMGAEEARALLAKHWAAIPYVAGLNNHEGSKATEDAALMAVVAGFLHEQSGYFLDSVTTAKSAIPKAAKAAGVAWAARRVFLDNVDKPEAIRSELLKAVALARKNGACIAIGHPRANTLALLKQMGPDLQAQVTFVHVSELLQR